MQICAQYELILDRAVELAVVDDGLSHVESILNSHDVTIELDGNGRRHGWRYESIHVAIIDATIVDDGRVESIYD